MKLNLMVAYVGHRFWVDTADKQPCIGTGGMLSWKLHTTGKLFHSGLPHKVVPPFYSRCTYSIFSCGQVFKSLSFGIYKTLKNHP